MKTGKLTLRLKLAWWFPYYLGGVLLMCRLTGRLPDSDRVGWWTRRAIRVVWEKEH